MWDIIPGNFGTFEAIILKLILKKNNTIFGNIKSQ